MATDVDAIYRDFGTASQTAIGRITPADLETVSLPAGSMGPKAEAAVTFVRQTGRRAAIGTLAALGGLVAGEQGTQIVPDRVSEPIASGA